MFGQEIVQLDPDFITYKELKIIKNQLVGDENMRAKYLEIDI
jgi:hypothetical protein